MVPEQLRYTKDHEWVRVEGKEAVIGITDYAQKSMGDLTFVELPKVGRTVAQFDSIGVLESVKAASDLFAPLAGTVAAVNTALEKTPELINTAPFDAGWICRLKGIDPAGLVKLMTAAQYEAQLPKE
jgi:glycine cleavage system H protein